jgi:hypothetical protein
MKFAARHIALFMIIPALALTGCVSREQADERLAHGCAAAAELFIAEGHTIKTITEKTFRDDPALGAGYRGVHLKAIESDGWADAEQDYKCIFIEDFGIFGTGHDAGIYQVVVGDNIYGKDGNEILGTFEEHLKLNETVDRAMSRFD